MDNLSYSSKIEKDTDFAYIYVNLGSFNMGFYVYANNPVEIVAHLFKNYIICLTDSVVDGTVKCDVNSEDVNGMIDYIKSSGHEKELQPIINLINETPENLTSKGLKVFSEKLRPIVNALNGAMDYTVCNGIIEFLQFLRQFDSKITVGELFDDYLHGAELNCDKFN